MNAKPKTFKIPLQKRTDFSFKSGVFDYKFIREHAAENPFGIEPDIKTEPNIKCTMDTACTAEYNPNTKLWGVGCKGTCQYC